MGWQFTPYTPILLAAAVSFLALVWYVFRRADAFSSRPEVTTAFLAVAVGGALATTTYALQLSSTTLGSKVFWSLSYWVGTSLVHVAWVVFVLAYTGRTEWLTRGTVALVSVVPALWNVLLWSGRFGDLVVTDVHLESSGTFVVLVADLGPLLLAFVGYLYAVDLLTMVLLGQLIVESQGVHRKQATTILIAGAVPLLASWASLADVFQLSVDLSPVSMLLMSAVTAWALFRYRFLDVVPVARSAILDEMQDGYVVLDEDQYVADLNETARERLGLQANAAVIGTPVEDVLATFPDLLDAVHADGERTVELCVERDGRRRYFDSLVSDRTNDRGDLVGYTVLLRDVTERTERERELRRQNERLDEFAGIASHDLRNPLAVARGRTQLAIEALATDEEGESPDLDIVRTQLEAVTSAHERMEDILDDLLTLARQGAELGETAPTEVATVADLAWQNVVSHDAELHVEEVGLVVADEGQLEQLFENLFANAVEHGGPAVTVRVGPCGDGFYVEDDGPGVPPGRRDRAFEHGYTTRSEGTGFGLSIVRRIADAHGWTVQVVDGADSGARFEFRGVDSLSTGGRDEQEPPANPSNEEPG